MKRKLLAILGIFSLVCIGLPFGVELIYAIGESHPIIYTNYSQSDVLGYIASVIGLIVSVIAIMLSVMDNEIDLKIMHALTASAKGNVALLIEICNYSGFDCMIHSVEICNKKEHRFVRVIPESSFEIKGKNSIEFVVEMEYIKKLLASIEKNGHKNIKYCIKLVGNKHLYLSTKDLYRYFSNIKPEKTSTQNNEFCNGNRE